MLSVELTSEVYKYVDNFRCYYCKEVPTNDAMVTKCGHVTCKNCLLKSFQKTKKNRCCKILQHYEDYFDAEGQHNENQYVPLNSLIAAAWSLQLAFAPQANVAKGGQRTPKGRVRFEGETSSATRKSIAKSRESSGAKGKKDEPVRNGSAGTSEQASGDPYEFTQQSRPARGRASKRKADSPSATNAATASAGPKKRGPKTPVIPSMTLSGWKARRRTNESLVEAEHEEGNENDGAVNGHEEVVVADAVVVQDASSLNGPTEWTHAYDPESDSIRFVAARDQHPNLDIDSPKLANKVVPGFNTDSANHTVSASKSNQRKSLGMLRGPRVEARPSPAPAVRFAKAPLDESAPKAAQDQSAAKLISPANFNATSSLNEPASGTPSLNAAIVEQSSSLHGQSDRQSVGPLPKLARFVDTACNATATYCSVALSPIRTEPPCTKPKACDVALSPVRFQTNVAIAVQTSPFLPRVAPAVQKEHHSDRSCASQPPTCCVPPRVSKAALSPVRIMDDQNPDLDDSESFILSQTPTNSVANDDVRAAPLAMQTEADRCNALPVQRDIFAIDSRSNSQFMSAASNPNSQLLLRNDQPTTNTRHNPSAPEDTLVDPDSTEAYVDAASRYEAATLNASEPKMQQSQNTVDHEDDDEVASVASNVSSSCATALPQPAAIARLCNVQQLTKSTTDTARNDEDADSDLETLARELPNVQRDLAAVHHDLQASVSKVSLPRVSVSSSQGFKHTDSATKPVITRSASALGSYDNSTIGTTKSDEAMVTALSVTSASSERRKIVAVVSTLNSSEKTWLTQFRECFASTLDIEVNAQFFADRTTHVIMGTPAADDEDTARIEQLAELLHSDVTCTSQRVCMRTVKYLLGIAAGCWVVNANWLRCSVERGALAQESSFEIVCDVELLHESNTSMSLDDSFFAETMKGRTEAPRRAREVHARAADAQLFKGSKLTRTVFTFSSANTCSVEELATLIERAGLRYETFDRLASLVRGKHLNGTQLLQTLDCDAVVGLIDAVNGRQSLSNNSLLERNRQVAKFKQLKVPQDCLHLISIEWLIDAIATFSDEVAFDCYNESAE